MKKYDFDYIMSFKHFWASTVSDLKVFYFRKTILHDFPIFFFYNAWKFEHTDSEKLLAKTNDSEKK